MKRPAGPNDPGIDLTARGRTLPLDQRDRVASLANPEQEQGGGVNIMTTETQDRVPRRRRELGHDRVIGEDWQLGRRRTA